MELEDIDIIKNKLMRLEENVINQNNVVNSLSSKLHVLNFICVYLFTPYIISSFLFFFSKYLKRSTNHSAASPPQNAVKKNQNHTSEIQAIKKDLSEQNEILNSLQNLPKEIQALKNDLSEQNEILNNLQNLPKEIQALKKDLSEQNEFFNSLQNFTKEIQALKNDSSEQNEILNNLQNLPKEIQSLKNDSSEQTEKFDGLQIIPKEIQNYATELQTIKDVQDKQKEKPIIKTAGMDMKLLLKILSKSFDQYFKTEIGFENEGILSILKSKEKNEFDKQFIASQSSIDIYSLIDPKSNGLFGTSNVGKAYIEFHLNHIVRINGVKIFSHSKCFPRSFDIYVNSQFVKSIKDATELNGSFKELIISLPTIDCSTFRIFQTGPNWDTKENYLNFKRIELLSPDEKYAEGVFSTMISESKTKNSHNCGVHILSTLFDFNSFYSIKSNCNMYISPVEKQLIPWFQVELARGHAVLHGFRIEKTGWKLKSFKIIATDEMTENMNLWETLIDINEQNEDEHQNLDIYHFKNPSSPVRFIRLVLTGPTWDNQTILTFYHLDFFGTYF